MLKRSLATCSKKVFFELSSIALVIKKAPEGIPPGPFVLLLLPEHVSVF